MSPKQTPKARHGHSVSRLRVQTKSRLTARLLVAIVPLLGWKWIVRRRAAWAADAGSAGSAWRTRSTWTSSDATRTTWATRTTPVVLRIRSASGAASLHFAAHFFEGLAQLLNLFLQFTEVAATAWAFNSRTLRTAIAWLTIWPSVAWTTARLAWATVARTTLAWASFARSSSRGRYGSAFQFRQASFGFLDAHHRFAGCVTRFFKNFARLFDFLAADFAGPISFLRWSIGPILAGSFLIADAWVGTILFFAIRLSHGRPEGEAETADPQDCRQAEA